MCVKYVGITAFYIVGLSLIHILFKANEMLGMRLAVMHNLWFYNTLMEKIREALDLGEFAAFREKYLPILGKRI